MTKTETVRICNRTFDKIQEEKVDRIHVGMRAGDPETTATALYEDDS